MLNDGTVDPPYAPVGDYCLVGHATYSPADGGIGAERRRPGGKRLGLMVNSVRGCLTFLIGFWVFSSLAAIALGVVEILGANPRSAEEAQHKRTLRGIIAILYGVLAICIPLVSFLVCALLAHRDADRRQQRRNNGMAGFDGMQHPDGSNGDQPAMNDDESRAAAARIVSNAVENYRSGAKVDNGSAAVSFHCPICFDEKDPNAEGVTAIQLNCGHVFDRECIETWFDHGKLICPVCCRGLPDLLIDQGPPDTVLEM